jgi:hypothetical protein
MDKRDVLIERTMGESSKKLSSVLCRKITKKNSHNGVKIQ